jgi:parvulin-like peptidyl-prolyl isomerase
MKIQITDEQLIQQIQQIAAQEEYTPEQIIVTALQFYLEHYEAANQDEDAFLWEQVEESYAYRRQHPEDLLTVTAEEWLTNTAYLHNE